VRTACQGNKGSWLYSEAKVLACVDQHFESARQNMVLDRLSKDAREKCAGISGDEFNALIHDECAEARFRLGTAIRTLDHDAT